MKRCPAYVSGSRFVARAVDQRCQANHGRNRRHAHLRERMAGQPDAASGQRSDAPVYVGNTTLLASIWRTLSTPGVVAVVTYGATQQAQGRDRRVWSADLRQTIQQLLSTAPPAAATQPPRANPTDARPQ